MTNPAEERKAKHAAEERVVKLSKSLAQAIAERDKLAEALTQLIYAIDLPSELGKIGSYTYLTAALQRLHGALSFARTALSTPRADEEDPASQAYDAARWEQRVAEPDEEPDYEHMEEQRHAPPVGPEWEDTKGRAP